MTQQATKKDYNSFVKGIITEAGALTFPENASLDEANCVLNRDGSRQRRLGMDFEDDFVLRNVNLFPDDAIASFRWFNVANDTDLQFAVVQVGAKLFVFNAKGVTSISASLIDILDISLYTNGKKVVGTSSGMGYFFVTGGVTNPLYISYDTVAGNCIVTPYTINVRDIFGVNDNLPPSTQPGSLTVEHNYNLLNQGWTDALISAYAGTGTYPSNAQQWFVGKDSDENFQAALLQKQDFGSTPAPKGRFVIDAFARSVSRVTQTGLALPVDIETGYPTVVGFGHQRVWYAGCQSKYTGASEFNPNYTGYVFYSRTLRSTKDFGMCHTEADPTSEIDSELVDTDGGFINIPDSGQIHKLLQKGNAMLVFAEHGIWAIMGGESGFTATAQQVVKLSEFGVLSGSTIVDAEDVVVYWNRGGIYLLSPDETTGQLSTKSISENSIQTLYNQISKAAKTYAVGTFDPINRRVSWLYNSDPDFTGPPELKNAYQTELVLDIVLGAFYKNVISSFSPPSPGVSGYLETPDFLLRPEGIRTRGDTVTKYLVVQYHDKPNNIGAISFGYFRDPTFRDWKSLDGEGLRFLSYMVTGYEIMGDTARDKQSPYLFMHFKRTEQESVALGDEVTADNPSGCFVQAQWDWSNHPDSGKWGEPFQAYRWTRPYILPPAGQPITYGYEVITTKNRLRGRGKALSLYIYSDEDKDFYLYGWSMRFTGSSYV